MMETVTANDLLDMKLREVSDVLCDKLVENKKQGKPYSCAELYGTNPVNNQRVRLMVVMEDIDL